MSQILGHPRWPTTPLAFCAGRQPARKWKKAERSNLTQRDKPLTFVPVINVLTNLIFCETVPLLNLTFELVPTTIYDVKVVVSKLSPFLLTLTFHLLPISFHSIPVHVNLSQSAHG